MENIKNYKDRFYHLMESTIGDVKPLLSENINISGRPTIINTDGTITINNSSKQPQKIRFELDFGRFIPSTDVNIVSIKPQKGGSYEITGKSGKSEIIGPDDVKKIISFVDNDSPNYISSSPANLMMKKVK